MEERPRRCGVLTPKLGRVLVTAELCNTKETGSKYTTRNSELMEEGLVWSEQGNFKVYHPVPRHFCGGLGAKPPDRPQAVALRSAFPFPAFCHWAFALDGVFSSGSGTLPDQRLLRPTKVTTWQ